MLMIVSAVAPSCLPSTKSVPLALRNRPASAFVAVLSVHTFARIPCLAASAWSRGIDTLVLDLDPQGNATTGLGVWDPPFSIDQALAEERPGSIAGLRLASSWPDEPSPVRVPSVVAATPALAMREPQLLTDPIGQHADR